MLRTANRSENLQRFNIFLIKSKSKIIHSKMSISFGPNLPRKNRVQLAQYHFHHFPTGLHLFLSGLTVGFPEFLFSLARLTLFKTLNENFFWLIRCQIESTRLEKLLNNFWNNFFPCFQNPVYNSTTRQAFQIPCRS